jgi:hypothetical protein
MMAALMRAITREIDAVTVSMFIVPRAGEWRLSHLCQVISTISHILLKPPVQIPREHTKNYIQTGFLRVTHSMMAGLRIVRKPANGKRAPRER